MSGATQRGLSSDDYPPACPDTANGCKDDYAVSIAGVQPSVYINWFQAVAACRNAGKRLATNLEWQMAALGTPDPGTDNGTTDCNIASTGRVNTGSRNLCVSDVSAFDMVGNVAEWVADRGAVSQCGNWDDAHGDDLSCVGSSSSAGPPSALYRGGSWGWGVNAGVFAVVGADQPDESFQDLGFRCAREL